MGICGSVVAESTDDYFESSFFGSVVKDPVALRTFKSLFSERSYGANETIVTEGAKVDDATAPALFRIVLSGAVNVNVQGKLLTRKSAGDVLALSLIREEQWVATVITETEVTCLEASKKAVMEFMFMKVHVQYKNKLLSLMGMNNTLTNFLSKMDIFATIKDSVPLLQNILQVQMHNVDHVLFEEGSLEPASLFILVSGTAMACTMLEDGQWKILREFGAGQVFGEVALLLGIPRTAAMVITDDNTVLLELRKKDFNNFLQFCPDTSGFEILVKRTTAEQFRKYQVPFFQSIPNDKYSVLSSLCEVKQMKADSVLFSEGDIGDKFYIVVHGSARVTVKTKPEGFDLKQNDDGSYTVATRNAGQYFGEIALIRDSTRTATVSLITDSVILSITRANFDQFFLHAPEAIADFEVKLAGVEVTIRSVLYHPIGYKYFSKHVEGEFSTENVEFWVQCRQFRHYVRHVWDLKLEENMFASMLTRQLSKSVAVTAMQKATSSNTQEPKRPMVSIVTELDKILALLSPNLDHSALDSKWTEGFVTYATDKGVVSLNHVRIIMTEANCIGVPSEAVRYVMKHCVVDGKAEQNLSNATVFPKDTYMKFAHVMSQLYAIVQGQVITLAEEIDEIYLKPSAEKNVNLSSRLVKTISKQIKAKEINVHTFDRAEEGILKLMDQDSFARFKGSTQFEGFLNEVGDYKTVAELVANDNHTRVRSPTADKGKNRKYSVLGDNEKEQKKGAPLVGLAEIITPETTSMSEVEIDMNDTVA